MGHAKSAAGAHGIIHPADGLTQQGLGRLRSAPYESLGTLWRRAEQERTDGREAGGDMSEAMPIVFVVDDDASVRGGLARLMRSVGLQIETFASVQEFLDDPRPDAPACLVLDVRLPGENGLMLQ